MSQHSQINYELLTQQQQKQLTALQAQIQVLLAEQGTEGGRGVSTEVAKPQVFDRTPEKTSGFIMVCKLYIRIKMREVAVKEQIQWILSYVQGELADLWKENILEDLEGELLEYETVGKFLPNIKKEFGERDEEIVKVAKLKRIEQGGEMIEKFVQEFKRAARDSVYEICPLIEEFKCSMNTIIQQRFMKSEHQLGTINQWYERATNLDRNRRESR